MNSRERLLKTLNHEEPDEKILERLEVDTRYVYLRASRDFQDKEFPVDVYEDEWGVRRKRISFYYDIVHHPENILAMFDMARDYGKYS